MSCMIDLTHATLCAAGVQPYYLGDDWSIIFDFGVDVAGMSFRGAVKTRSGTVLLNRDSADTAELEILSPTTLGQVKFKIARAEASSLVAGDLLLDVVRVAADSSEQTWAYALFEARARATPTPLP